jgi:hypothetical protein
MASYRPNLPCATDSEKKDWMISVHTAILGDSINYKNDLIDLADELTAILPSEILSDETRIDNINWVDIFDRFVECIETFEKDKVKVVVEKQSEFTMTTEEIISFNRQFKLAEYVGDIVGCSEGEFSVIPTNYSVDVKKLLLQLIMSGIKDTPQLLPTAIVNELTDLCNYLSPQNEFLKIWHFIVMSPFYDTLHYCMTEKNSHKLRGYSNVFGKGATTASWMDDILLDTTPRYVMFMPDISKLLQSTNNVDITLIFMTKMIRHQIYKGTFRFPYICIGQSPPKTYMGLARAVVNSHHLISSTHPNNAYAPLKQLWDISSFVDGFSSYILLYGNKIRKFSLTGGMFGMSKTDITWEESKSSNATLVQCKGFIDIVTDANITADMDIELYGIRNGVQIKIGELTPGLHCFDYSIDSRGCMCNAGCNTYNLATALWDMRVSSCITIMDNKLIMYTDTGSTEWEEIQRYINPSP